MADILDHTPTWRDQFSGGEVISSDLYISLGPPASDPEQIDLELFVAIVLEDGDEDEDNNDEDDDEYNDADAEDNDEQIWRWKFGISEEDAGFGEAEFESGQSEDLESAKIACWHAVVLFLKGEGFSEAEIIASA